MKISHTYHDRKFLYFSLQKTTLELWVKTLQTQQEICYEHQLLANPHR